VVLGLGFASQALGLVCYTEQTVIGNRNTKLGLRVIYTNRTIDFRYSFEISICVRIDLHKSILALKVKSLALTLALATLALEDGGKEPMGQAANP